MDKILCALGIHKYDKWFTEKTGRLVSRTGNYTGYYKVQTKHCQRCGLIKGRTIKY